jgi:cell division protein FtsQ
MPRVNATARPGVSRPATRARVKKITVPQDRLSAQKLFFRRVKRSIKPGLWILAVIAVLIVVSELFRSLPSIEPRPAVVRHSSFGLAGLAAAMGLRISHVEYVGAQAIDPAALAAAVGVQQGDPTLGFSLAAMQQRVEQLGPVQSVTVQRELPGTLVVTISERDAFAIWQTGGNGAPAKFALIDKAGDVIADQNAAEAKRREPNLMLLVGTDAPKNAQSLMAELKTSPSVLSHVAASERVDGLRWNLLLKNQTLVKLPALGEADAIAQLAALQGSMQLLDRPVEVIDLRMPGRLVVRPYPVATPALDATKKTGTKK